MYKKHLGQNPTKPISHKLKLKQKSREDYKMRNFMLCTPYQTSFGWSNQEELDGQGT